MTTEGEHKKKIDTNVVRDDRALQLKFSRAFLQAKHLRTTNDHSAE